MSTAGGVEPLWSRNGKELFYVTEGHMVFSAAVTTTPGFQVLPPERLFATAGFVLYGVFNRNYDQMPDHRLLMIRRGDEVSTRLVAVFNWRAQLGAR